MGKTMFSGISAPQLTPFYDDGEVNYEEYTRLTCFLADGGVDGIFVCGTTGEFVNLTMDERKRLLLAAKKGAGDNCRILYNVTAMNLKDIDELICWAKEYGADAVSVTPPYYHKYDSMALTDYFVKVAALAGPLPVYLYNIPSMASNAITPEVLKNVCSSCKNIRGIKDSSMDFMMFLKFQMAAPDKDFEVLTGNDAQVLTALQAGGSGAVVAMAGVYPRLCREIYDSYRRGETAKARAAQDTVLKLRELVRGTIPVVAHKEMLKMQGFCMGKSRFPLRELTEQERGQIHSVLRELSLYDEEVEHEIQGHG